MEINQVRFGNYTIANSNAKTNQEGKKKEETTQIEAKNINQNVEAEKVLNAMDLAALQNKAQINVSPKAINPSDYLSEERIKDIEAMMGEFENGVAEIAQSIEEEFPNMLSQEQKNELAASVYTAE